jgi:hypothetical protein
METWRLLQMMKLDTFAVLLSGRQIFKSETRMDGILSLTS